MKTKPRILNVYTQNGEMKEDHANFNFFIASVCMTCEQKAYDFLGYESSPCEYGARVELIATTAAFMACARVNGVSLIHYLEQRYDRVTNYLEQDNYHTATLAIDSILRRDQFMQFLSDYKAFDKKYNVEMGV